MRVNDHFMMYIPNKVKTVAIPVVYFTVPPRA